MMLSPEAKHRIAGILAAKAKQRKSGMQPMKQTLLPTPPPKSNLTMAVAPMQGAFKPPKSPFEKIKNKFK